MAEIERRVNVRGIIFNNNQILAQKFKDQNGNESDYWGTPGGGLDRGESLHDGLRREMIEETGIAPKIGKLLFMQQFKMPQWNGEIREHLEFFFHIENPEDYLSIDLEKTSHGAIELTRCEFIDPTTERLLPAFLQTITIANYIESEQPTLLINNLYEHKG